MIEKYSVETIREDFAGIGRDSAKDFFVTEDRRAFGMSRGLGWFVRRVAALGLVAACSGTMQAQRTMPAKGVVAEAAAAAPATVDVIALNEKTLSIVPNLTAQDFVIHDDGKKTPVVGFASGLHFQVAPIALWLVLECNNYGVTDFASGFMRGQTQYLLPALAHLDKADAVGVAHWCGNGEQAIDLEPERDPQAAIEALNKVLKQKAVEGANRQAEDAKERMINLILTQTKTMKPRPTPVIVFLYGDAGFAFRHEAEGTLINLLSTPSFVYGLNNAGYHFDPSAMFGGGNVYYEIHFLSISLGGNVYGTPYPKQYSMALDDILMQMHFRYTLGFKPAVMDSKRHDLKITLTDAAAKRFPDAVLRYRAQYIPAPGPLVGPS